MLGGWQQHVEMGSEGANARITSTLLPSFGSRDFFVSKSSAGARKRFTLAGGHNASGRRGGITPWCGSLATHPPQFLQSPKLFEVADHPVGEFTDHEPALLIAHGGPHD